jgi:hypothetical protein
MRYKKAYSSGGLFRIAWNCWSMLAANASVEVRDKINVLGSIGLSI